MLRFLACLALVVAVPAAAASAQDAPATPEEAVLGMIDAINNRDWDALKQYVAEDVHRVSGATPDVTVENRAEFVAYLKKDLSAFPDAVQEVDRIFSCGDMVGVRAFYRGTQTGVMGTYPPSGKRLDLPFLGILRVKDGKVAEMWVEWDNLNALSQLGDFPPGSQK